MIVILSFGPRYLPDTLSEKLVPQLEETFHGLDILVFNPDYVIKHLDATYKDLRQRVQVMRDGGKALFRRDFVQIRKIFRLALHSERDMLIVEGFIVGIRTLREWEGIRWRRATQFSFFDYIDNPPKATPQKERYHKKMTSYLKNRRTDRIQGIVSFRNLHSNVVSILRAKGARELTAVYA
ncbi:MAG: hypothetical protein V4686_00580 [Patescibacteria group bacterium]